MSDGILSGLADQAPELHETANSGDAESQYWFGFYILFDENFKKRPDLSADDAERAFSYWRAAAQQGGFDGAAAAMQLAECYFNGEFVPKDLKAAKLWYTTAAMNGNHVAICALGDYYYQGLDGPVDYEKAAVQYIQAMPKFRKAHYLLGDMLLQGQFFPADPELARRLYEFVVEDGEYLLQKAGIRSDELKQAIQRIDNMERNSVSMLRSTQKLSRRQAALKKQIIQNLERDEAELQKKKNK